MGCLETGKRAVVASEVFARSPAAARVLERVFDARRRMLSAKRAFGKTGEVFKEAEPGRVSAAPGLKPSSDAA